MQSDAEIRSWANHYYFPYQQNETARRIQTSFVNIQNTANTAEQRIPAIRDSIKLILQEMPVASKSKQFLFALRAQVKRVLQQAEQKEVDMTFQKECRDLIHYVDRILDILYPKPEFQISDVHTPTESMRSEGLVDPITLEPLTTGTLYAFYQGRFVGSYETVQEMIQRSVRGSDTAAVFVPLQNRLIPIDHIQWFRW